MLAGAVVALKLAVSHPVASPAPKVTGSRLMLVSGATPPFVTLTVTAAGFVPLPPAKVTAVWSSVIVGVGGGVIVNGADVADARPVDAKPSVRSPAEPAIDRVLNATPPAAAVTVDEPPSVPPPEAMDAVTDAVDVVTTLPAASRISSTGCVLSAL